MFRDMENYEGFVLSIEMAIQILLHIIIYHSNRFEDL
jgi:hypothetical protein